MTSSNKTLDDAFDEPWPEYSYQVREAETIEKILAPWLSIISILLNVTLACYILSKKDLRKFTFIVVSYQVSTNLNSFFYSIFFSKTSSKTIQKIPWVVETSSPKSFFSRLKTSDLIKLGYNNTPLSFL